MSLKVKKTKDPDRFEIKTIGPLEKGSGVGTEDVVLGTTIVSKQRVEKEIARYQEKVDTLQVTLDEINKCK